MAPQRQKYRPDPGGQFDSDAHRRVAANLSLPRSLEDLAATLADDPSFPEISPAQLQAIVDELKASGQVKSLGDHDDVDALIKAIKADKAVPTLPKAKAEHFKLRTIRRGLARAPHVVSGEQLYFTNDAVDLLTAPLPDEPPELEGPALEIAEEQDQALNAETERRVAEDVARLRKQHEEGLAEIGADA